MLTAWIRIARLWWRRWSKRIKKCSQGISHLGWLAWTMNSQYEVTARHQNDSRPHCPFTNICVKCECMMGIPWIRLRKTKRQHTSISLLARPTASWAVRNAKDSRPQTPKWPEVWPFSSFSKSNAKLDVLMVKNLWKCWSVSSVSIKTC